MEEHIVLSMLVLKFHLRIDIKEISSNTSRVGKDLSEDDISFLLTELLLSVLLRSQKKKNIVGIKSINFY